jgi:hypothetical protein
VKANELTRFQDWEDRLGTYIERCRDDKFTWGQHDCAMFADGVVRAITGHEYANELKNTYSTKREAAETIRKLGHQTYRHAVIERLGKPVHAAQARRGDLVMRGRTALGVCVGRWSYFVGEDQRGDRLVIVPTLECRDAWRVG